MVGVNGDQQGFMINKDERKFIISEHKKWIMNSRDRLKLEQRFNGLQTYARFN